MHHLELLNSNVNYSAAVELTMVDGMRNRKNVLLLFNLEDEWRAADGFTETEVHGMFAGHIMEVFKKDSSAFAYKATGYTIENSILKKTVSFTPMVKVDDDFAECFIHADGRVELVD